MRMSWIPLLACVLLLLGCRNPLGPFETPVPGLEPPVIADGSPDDAPFDRAPAWEAQQEAPPPAPGPAPAPTPASQPAAAPGAPGTPARTGGLPFRQDLPFETVLREAAAMGRPVLLYFETQRCGWCDRLKQDTFSEPDVRGRLDSGFVTARYDAGRGPGRALAQRFGMPGYPVIVVTNASGSELGRIVGYREPRALLGELARY